MQAASRVALAEDRLEAAPPARLARKVPQQPLRDQDAVGRLRQRLERQLDLVLLPDPCVHFVCLDVADLAMAVLHRDADLGEKDHRPPPQRLAEHERRAGVVAPLRGAVDVVLLRPLAQEELDFTESLQLDPHLALQPVERPPDHRVGGFGQGRPVTAVVPAEDHQRRVRGERVDEGGREPGPQNHVGGGDRHPHRAEQAGPVGPLAERKDIAKVPHVTGREVERLQPAVPSDVHEADEADAEAFDDPDEVVHCPLFGVLADQPGKAACRQRVGGRIEGKALGSGAVGAFGHDEADSRGRETGRDIIRDQGNNCLLGNGSTATP